MLLKLEIQNFYSIKDKMTLDFSVPGTTPKSDRLLQSPLDPGIRVPSVNAIFGANASGKTSILRAITFMTNTIVRSFEGYKPGDPMIVNSFACNSHITKPCCLAMEFITGDTDEDSDLNNRWFRYEIEIIDSFEESYILRECLKGLNSGGKVENIFNRNRKDGKDNITAAKWFDLSPRDPRRDVRENVSLISSLVQFNHKSAVNIRNAVNRTFYSNLSVSKFTPTEEIVTSFLYKYPVFLERLNSIIRIIDVGIERVEISDKNGTLTVLFFHSGLDFPRIFAYESQGTQSFYLNFLDLNMALSSGGISVMDELDADLHPDLMGEIISWFHDSERNPLGAQLIMTCHNTSLLSDLSKEEIWITEKNTAGETSAFSLGSVSGVRRDANLYSKYMSGEYGGVPRFG